LGAAAVDVLDLGGDAIDEVYATLAKRPGRPVVRMAGVWRRL